MMISNSCTTEFQALNYLGIYIPKCGLQNNCIQNWGQKPWEHEDYSAVHRLIEPAENLKIQGGSEFMGKTFQAAQLTHERFLT